MGQKQKVYGVLVVIFAFIGIISTLNYLEMVYLIIIGFLEYLFLGLFIFEYEKNKKPSHNEAYTKLEDKE